MCVVIGREDLVVGWILDLINVFDFVDGVVCEVEWVCGKVCDEGGVEEDVVWEGEWVGIGLVRIK